MSAVPALPTLRATLARLPALELDAVHVLETPAQLPAFKGLLWHAVFGAALHAECSAAFEALLGPGQAHRPWVLQPPLDARTQWDAGAMLPWRLRLFGDATQHAPACERALRRFGAAGLGDAAQRAALLCLRTKALRLDEALAGAGEGGAAEGLELQLLTPLSVRRDGRVAEAIPDLPLLLRRLLARVAHLAPRTPAGLLAGAEREELLALAAASPCSAHDLAWSVLPRHSARQQRTMPLAGWQGSLRFTAPAQALRPCFALGGLLQLGARTTFGFGVIA